MAGREVSDSVRRQYNERLKYLRRGQESFQAKDVTKAVQYYATYLKALAVFFGINETDLDPKYFDLQMDKAELLLISQVYWDLAKSYDRSPGLQNECVRCLNQFVKFTVGFKHQHISSQLLKKYIRQNVAINQEAFKGTLTKIQVDSKNCYIVTLAFGNEHSITNDLRFLKKMYLSKKHLGLKFIDFYYSYSPKLVEFCETNKKIGSLLTLFIFRPIIFSIHILFRGWRKFC